MNAERFQVVLLPQQEQLVADCSLAEAGAYVQGYREGCGDGPSRAVIALRGGLGSSSRTRRRLAGRPSLGVALHDSSSATLRSA